ncbi:MAG: DUF3892 domain-containing protein [Hyphomicrobiaceae bacterium]
MPRISCINKHDRHDPSERIIGVGGVNPDGSRWWMTQRDAIAWTEDPRKEKFWVDRTTHRVAVIVKVSRFGNKYLTTEADGESQNNLLSLRECAR